MPASPLVSIVIPAYNNATTIAETMRSVLAQTYPTIEVIVADHASSDGTREALAEFASDARVTVLDTPAGGGAVRNWNRVTEAARGEFVKLVCGDDLISPECVDKQVAAFADGVVMVASPRSLIDARGKTLMRKRGLTGLAGRRSGADAIRETVRQGGNAFGEPACVTFRRAELVAAGLWDPTQHYLIDVATYVAVLRRGDFVGIDEVLASFRVSSGQWSVRLAASQAEETTAYFTELQAAQPDLLTAQDVRTGARAARRAAQLRRLAYWFWSRRMNDAAVAPA